MLTELKRMKALYGGVLAAQHPEGVNGMDTQDGPPPVNPVDSVDGSNGKDEFRYAITIPEAENVPTMDDNVHSAALRKTVIGKFSLPGRGQFSLDGAPKRLYPRDLGLYDLNRGFEVANLICRDINGDPQPNYWSQLHVGDDLLPEIRGFYRWINETKYFIQYGAPHLVAYNMDLARIMCTPYMSSGDRTGWKMLFCRLGGTIFMLYGGTSPEPEAMPEDRAGRERQLRGGYHGLKLKSLLTTPPERWADEDLELVETEDGKKVVGNPLKSVKIDEFDKFHHVFQAEIGGLRSLVLSNPVDCLDPNGNRVDISVSSSTSSQWFYGSKLLGRWSHCVLDGTPLLLIGTRRVADGDLRSVRAFQVAKIPSAVAEVVSKRMADEFKAWQPEVCISFLHRFLAFLRGHLPRSSSPDEVWLATCNPPTEEEESAAATGPSPLERSVSFKLDTSGRLRFLPKDLSDLFVS